jgi:single-stranded DNA-binding protein
MYRFTAQGRIGRIDELKKNGLRLSIAADRLVDGPDGQWTKTEWLSLISFDAVLNTKMLTELESGMSVKIEGRIEPRKRPLGDTKIYDHNFVVIRFERLSKPKANGKAKSAEADQPGA